MPSLLPFTIPSDFAATAPGRKNPSANFWMLDTNPDSPPSKSYLSLGSPTVATTSYTVVASDYSIGSNVDAPWLTALLIPAAADVASTPNDTWKMLRAALDLPVTGHLLLQDGASVRFYDAVLGSKLRGLQNALFIHLIGECGSLRV